jgi:hypothetical protein
MQRAATQMNPKVLEEQDWRILLKSIRQRQCILLLGPGAAVDPSDLGGNPLTVRLANTLAEALRNARKDEYLIAPDDLAHVAQIYQREMPKKRPGLEIAVEDFYRRQRTKTSALHQDLAALPFPLCVNTTPEGFFLNALQQIPGKEPLHDFYHFQPDPKWAAQRPPSASPPEKNPDTRPLVYDLYGSLDETDSLVLTESDLLDFLVNVTRQAPPLHTYVSSLIGDPSVSFLFLGFGFRHWYMRILLHALKASGHEAPSLALEDEAFFTSPEHSQTALFFRSGHFMEFHQLPSVAFAHELRNRFEETFALRQRAEEARLSIPDGAPIVFLCHENRDKIAADAIACELEARGIKVWLDRQSLRGGDNWVRLIPHVIEKQTNYVVVLQSPRMLDKPESYFWREIAFAIERQTGFGTDFRFLIPILIETHHDLPLRDLSRLHNVDLTQPNGIDALAQTITEDWKRRQPLKGAQ